MKPEMSHTERVFCALERREPDRVPLFELVFDEGVMDALLPGCDYYTFADWIGLDVIGLNRSTWSRENVDFVDEEKGLFRDEWGVIKALGPESTPYPVQGPIQRPEDLRTYTPPDPDRPGVLGHLPEVVARYKGRKPIIFMARDAFFHPTFLRGMDNYLMDMVINPHLVHELVEVCQSHDLKVMEKAVQAGADIIVFGDDYACNTGPLMSPKHFREFVLPGLRKAVRRAKEAGAYVIKHTDGNLEPLLDMIVDTGIDALHSIEPAAGMDIGQVKARYGDRIALIGNIDCGHLLSHGTTDEVRAAVRACLAAAAPGGGHLLSSSNSIHSSVRPENYLAMVEALREYGNYPLAW